MRWMLGLLTLWLTAGALVDELKAERRMEPFLTSHSSDSMGV